MREPGKNTNQLAQNAWAQTNTRRVKHKMRGPKHKMRGPKHKIREPNSKLRESNTKMRKPKQKNKHTKIKTGTPKQKNTLLSNTFKKGDCDIDGECMDHTAFPAIIVFVPAAVRQTAERSECLCWNLPHIMLARILIVGVI